MSTIATLITRFTSDTAGFRKGLAEVQTGAASAERTVGGMGNGMKTGLAIGAVAAAAVGTAIIKTGQDFEASYNTIRRETGATGSALDSLKESMRRVYSQRPENMPEVTDAIVQLNRQSGLTGDTLERTAMTSLRLASITRSDLGATLQTTQQVMNSWGITAEQQVPKLDVLYRAHQRTGVSVTDLGSVMASQGPILRQLGFSFEDSAALLGLLHQSGVDTGPVMLALSRSIKEAADQGRPAGEVLRSTFDAIRNAPSDTVAAGAAIDIFGARAGPRLAGLIREGKLSFDELSASIASGSDTIDQAAKDTATGTGRMKVAWHDVQVAVEPIAIGLMGLFADFAGAVRSVADTMGPVFVPAVLGVGGALGILAIAFKVATIVAAIFGTTVATVFWPVTAVIAALLVLGAGIYLIVRNFDSIVSFFKGPWGNAVLGAVAVMFPLIGIPLLIWRNWGTIVSFFQGLWDSVTSVFGGAVEAIVGFFTSLPGRVADLVGAVVDFFAALPGRILAGLAALPDLLIELFSSAIAGVVVAVAYAAIGLWLFFTQLVPTVIGLIIDFAPRLAAWAVDAMVWLARAVVDGAVATFDFFTGLPGRVIDLITDLAPRLYNFGLVMLGRLRDGAVEAAGAVFSFFAGLPGRIVTAVGDLGNVLVAAGEAVIDGLVRGAENALGKVGDFFGKVGDKIAGWKGPLDYDRTILAPAGTAIMQGLIDSVAAQLPELQRTMGTVTATIAATAVTGPSVSAGPAPAGPAPAAAPDVGGFAAAASGAFGDAAAAAAGYGAALDSVGATTDAFLAARSAATDSYAAAEVNAWTTMAAQLGAISAAMGAALAADATNLAGVLTAAAVLTSASVQNAWAQMAAGVGFISGAMAARFAEVMNAMVVAAITGGTNTSSGLQGTLGAAASPIAEIVRGYARSLRDALNPILTGIGEATIALPFATGGVVPGNGTGDTVPAMLSPGEFVIRRDVAERMGFDTLNAINRGWVRGYQAGGAVQGGTADMAAAQRYAESMVGKPYIYGGVGYAGADCSGLWSGIYATAMGLPMARYFTGGIALPSGSAQAASLGFAPGPGSFMMGARGTPTGPTGHIAGTLNGLNYEAGHTPIQGPRTGARGAFDIAMSADGGRQVIHLASAGGGGFVVLEPVVLPSVPSVTTGGAWLGGTATKLMGHVGELAQAFVDAKTIVISAMSGNDPMGMAVAGDLDSWIIQALQITGSPMGWLAGLRARAMQESGGNPRAINNWDSNARAGIPSKGLMQTIDPTFNAYKLAGYGDIWNPVHNMIAAIRYIASRYGTPYNLPRGGYAGGGIFPATGGGILARLAEGGQDEAVIPLPTGWRAMFASGGPAGGAAPAVSGPAVHIEHYEVKEDADHRRIFAMAEFEQRAGRI